MNFKKGKGLIIVAHPDDETIWMGGAILSFKNIKWTILSLSRKNDPDRALRFKKACKFYKAKSIISDLEDEGIMDIKESLLNIKKMIKSTVIKNGKNKFNYIFTHGYLGEYGHPRHKGVHFAVKNLIEKKFLSADYFFNFSYKKGPVDFSLRLKPSIFKKKLFIIKKIYGFYPLSFEYKSCKQTENFRIIKK